jgi:hypothetical protein
MARGVAQEAPETGLHASAPERAALEQHRPIVGKEAVGLEPQRQHGGIATVVDEADAGRQGVADARNKRLLPLLAPDGRGGDEIDAVGVDLDRGGPRVDQTLNDLLNDSLPGQRHAFGGRVVVEQPPTVTEIAVEGIDQDLEATLHPFPHRLLGFSPGGRRRTTHCLRIEPAAGQVLEHRQVGAKGVAGGGDALGEHDRGIEALDVALDDRRKGADGEQLGVTAGIVAGGLRGRQAVVVHDVGTEHQVVDLFTGPAVGHRLEGARHELGLIELGRCRQAGQGVDVAHVVEGIPEEPVAIGLPDLANESARNELTTGARQPQFLDGTFQTVGAQAPGRVVTLDLLVGVDDVATMDVGRAEGDGQRAGFEANGVLPDAKR